MNSSSSSSSSNQQQEKVSVKSIASNELSDHSELELRYDNLSSDLKKCFSYFSLFPKDWKFDRENLIQMWKAEDIQYSGDICNEYFHKLVSCSFFQNVEYDLLGDITTFKLHHDVHDFAQSVAGVHDVAVLSLSEYEKTDTSDEIRRLQLVLDETKSENSTVLLRGKNLQTIFCKCDFGWNFDIKSESLHVIHLAGVRNNLRLFSKGMRYLHLTDCVILEFDIKPKHDPYSPLRTLNLINCRNVPMVLREIRYFPLWHLSISGSDVGMLPKYIVEFDKLQTLDISGCNISVLSFALSDRTKFPEQYKNIVKRIGEPLLENLVSLNISHTPITEIDESITRIPSLRRLEFHHCHNLKALPRNLLRALTQLRSLDLEGTSITELPNPISRLCGLSFRHRKDLKSLPSNLEEAVQLRSLNLEGSGITELPDSFCRIYSLERLELGNCGELKSLPHDFGALAQLRSLNLEGSGITELPDSICRIYSLERLELGNCRELKSLPHDFGALAQLRSLNLEGSGITELPDSICRIYSLERLELGNCRELKSLPHDFGASAQLRSLNLEGSGITELPESLTSNLWKFKSVNTNRLVVLVPYLVKKMEKGKKSAPLLLRISESSGINELAGLNSLRVLEIRHLENVRGLEDARSAQLRNKQHLRELSLKWEEEGATNSSMVLLGLWPHSNLEKLVIEYFSGIRLPKWMDSSPCYLPKLVELYLSNCNSCKKLPALGMLPCLRVLWIYGMSSMKCLGKEFYYQEDDDEEQEDDEEEITIFPALTRLELGDMDKLEEWVAPPPPPKYISFPVLETLCIIGCCELTSIPNFRLCTSLRKLSIEECDKLKSTLYDFIQKEEQSEDSSEEHQSSDSISNDRYLVKEIISGAPEDSGIQDIAALQNEEFLHIRNLENVRGGKEVAEKAKLKDKQHLEDLYLSWNSSSSIDDYDEYIDRSVNDEMTLEGLQPHPNLKKLTISGFRGFKLPKWMGLSSYLPCLVDLYFYGCNCCEHLPALGMLPCLEILQIEGMNSVQSLADEFYYQQPESSRSSSNGEIKEEKINNDKQATTASSSSSSSGTVFPSLVALSLIDMSILKEWAAPHLSFTSFPSLERLIVSGCSRLKSIPFTSLYSLKSLVLCDTNDEAVNTILASSGGERLISLTSVSIQYSPQLQFFPVVLLPSYNCIQSLEIAHCFNFRGFRIQDNNEFHEKESLDTGFSSSISSIRSLKLFDCPALASVPDLREWNSLTKLWIEDCDKLKGSFSYSLKSLTHLETLYVDRFIELPQKNTKFQGL